MADRDLAIDVVDVSKRFRLHRDRPASIKEAVLRRKRSEVDEFWALRDVNLAIPKGSFYGLIGHNGSGKSTMFRLMAGIHEPTSGSISVDGRISALLELGSGFHPDLTGRENIFLNGAILGLSNSEIRGSVDKIIEFSGLEDFIDTPVKAYSSGMYVRLGFAISVNVDPQILLIDEVLAVGDEDFQRRCFDHLYMLRRKGVTIVLVSHAIALVQSLCDEVAWLDHGKLQVAGEPEKTVQAYMSHVNRQEAARLSHEESTDESGLHQESAGERSGSGEIRVSRVEFRDAAGDELQAAHTGDTFVVRINYDVRLPVQDPVFSISFHHENGTLVADHHTTGAQRLGRLETGPGYIEARFDSWPIMHGQYFVSTSIHSSDQLHRFDQWDRSHKLIVQPGQSDGGDGLVDLRPQWGRDTAL